MVMSWPEAIDRIRLGQDATRVVEHENEKERQGFEAHLLAELGPAAVERHRIRLQDFDSGVTGARNTWGALTPQQQSTLKVVHAHGGRLERVGKAYRHRDRNQPYRPVYVPTVRSLCDRLLMKWDGLAFDPEGAAILTERGIFVVVRGTHKTV